MSEHIAPPVPEQLGDAPIESGFQAQMNAIAAAIDGYLNGEPIEGQPRPEPKVGWILMCFYFGASGRCNYISNAYRPDVVRMLKEQLRYFEGQPRKRAKRKRSKHR